MKCNECGLENPRQSKFCRKCGNVLEKVLKCSHCDHQNPIDSLFCIECGQRLSNNGKATNKSERKCRCCGHTNELDTLFCVRCGTKLIGPSGENNKRKGVQSSYRRIFVFVGLILVAGFAIKLGSTLLKKGDLSNKRSSNVVSVSSKEVNEEQVLAVAKHFNCACGGCGELPLTTCECDMSKGSVEEKQFIRKKLSEGFTVEQVVECLDREYGHRV